MFTKSLFVIVAFGAVGLAPSGNRYLWRESKRRSAYKKEIEYLKVHKFLINYVEYIHTLYLSTELMQ